MVKKYETAKVEDKKTLQRFKFRDKGEKTKWVFIDGMKSCFNRNSELFCYNPT